MNHAVQVDTFNCGIYTGNSIAHAALGIPLCEDANLSRLQWFLDLSSEAVMPSEVPPALPSSSATTLEASSPNNIHAPDSDLSNLYSPPALTKTHRMRVTIQELLNDDDDNDTMSIWTSDAAPIAVNISSGAEQDFDMFPPSPSAPSSPTLSLNLATHTTDWSSDPDASFFTNMPLSPNSSSPDMGLSENRSSSPMSIISKKASSFDVDASSDTSKKSFTDYCRSLKTNINNCFKRKKAQYKPSSDASSDSNASDTGPRFKRVKPGEGQSRSAKAERKQRQALKTGTYRVKDTKLQRWRDTIRELDPSVEFDEKEIRRFRCSRCGEWRLVKRAYDLGRHEDHWNKDCSALRTKSTTNGTKSRRSKVASAASNPPNAKRPSLFALGFTKSVTKSGSSLPTPKTKSTSSATIPSAPEIPCPGITPQDSKQLEAYLDRTAAVGGGGKSISHLALVRFGCKFSELTPEQKDQILVDQIKTHTWSNYHKHRRVFAVNCQKTVPDHSPKHSPACTNCRAVLNSKKFQTALRRQGPDDENYSRTNFMWRNPVLGKIYARVVGLKEIIEAPNDTPCLKYAKGALKGKYKNEVFSGLMEAIVTEGDRKAEGKGMQNFHYAPAWDELAHIIKIHSTRAFNAISEYLPMRSERSFR